MSQFRQFLKASHTALANTNSNAVVATVVKVEGSSYRRTGAKMVISEQSQLFGSISGGCLESEVCKRAWWMTQHVAVVKKYSTETDGEDAEFAFGLGCDGIIYVLLERLNSTMALLTQQLIDDVYNSYKAGAQATVIAIRELTPNTSTKIKHNNAPDLNTGNIQIGQKIILSPTTGMQNHIIYPNINTALHTALNDTLHNQKNSQLTYQCNDIEIDVFFEFIAPPLQLIICGAGQDAQPLVHMASSLGFDTVVIDSRPHYVKKIRFPNAKELMVIDVNSALSEQIHQKIQITPNTAIVIMSHSLTQDRFWLGYFLQQAVLYVGQLGPRYRTERLLTEIEQELGFALVTDHLHYPVGLDLGGDTPEMVALAILAEITSIINQRNGGSLKNRIQPIHAVEPLVHITVV